jgi:RHS repeat-associated protein
MLKDDEVFNGSGNSYTTYFRQHDTRLGRWFSVDPEFQPWQSPYTSMDNNPIMFTDPLGDSPVGQFFSNMFKGGFSKAKHNLGLKNNLGSAVSMSGGLRLLGAVLNTSTASVFNANTMGPPNGGDDRKKQQEQYRQQVRQQREINAQAKSNSQTTSNTSNNNSNLSSINDISTILGITGETMIYFGYKESVSLYQKGFRKGLNGNYQLTGRNLSLFGNTPMSNATQPLSKMASFGRPLTMGGTALSVFSIAFDVNDYMNNQNGMNGYRLSYRTTTTSLATLIGLTVGGPYGVGTGLVYMMGEKAWDMTKPTRDEIWRQYWDVEMGLRRGWRKE